MHTHVQRLQMDISRFKALYKSSYYYYYNNKLMCILSFVFCSRVPLLWSVEVVFISMI